MSKTNRLNEKNRAERLAHDLDYRLQNQAYTEQTALEDQPLLVLAEELSVQNPLSATNIERTQLRKRFEQAKTSKIRNWKPLPFFRFLKPTAQMTLWALLLVGVFAITMVLVSNLVGKPSHPIAGPAQTTSAPGATSPSRTETPPAPKPVTINLEQALALVQYPTWRTALFEYQVSWRDPNNDRRYSFYKQVWMDREGRGSVLTSDQVDGTDPRSPDVKPILLFISDGTHLKALHLPGGQEDPGFANSPWLVSPLENAGQNMADFFPTINGLGKVGTLRLSEYETEVAGRPALLLYGSEHDYWFDRETGLLLQKAHRADGMIITVRAIAYDVEIPKALDEAVGLDQIAFLDTLPTKTAENLSTPQAAFKPRTQTVNGIPLELRDLVIIGTSPRATICYPAPGEGDWRIEGVTVDAGGNASVFYPSDSAQHQPGADGMTCQTFTAAYPVRTGSSTGEWKLTVQRLVGPRQTTPVCEEVAKQITNDHPGLTIECRASDGMPSYTFGEPPAGMQLYEASRLIHTYFEADVRGGPWTFTVNPSEVTFLNYTASPVSLVVTPSDCDPASTLLQDAQFTQALGSGAQPNPTGIAGGGTLQSGSFTFLMGLACDPNFSRLKTYGDERSFINGLGVLFAIRYDGPPTGDGVEYFTGVWPFVMHQGGGGSLGSGEFLMGYEGLLLPDTVQPDLTQSDVRLRYLARVRLPDGSIDGAALVFTLQRAFEGYRPVDVTVEPLTEAEKLTAELTTNPTGPLPFPTLAVPEASVSAQNQAVLDLMDRWQKPLLSSPGWIHTRTRTEMPGGNDLYAGLTEYLSDDWYLIDAQTQVIATIHIDRRLDGTPLQQVVSQNGQSTNLTFGGGGEFKPYLLDLRLAVTDTLRMGDQVKHAQITVNGKPAIQLTLTGMFTRRDAVDATTGAWLYTETVKVQQGEDPQNGGSLDNRTTLEIAERVGAPPSDALALLGKDFSAYTPSAPYGTPAPQGFDPSRSKLILNSVQGDSFHGPTFWYGDMYASDELSGQRYFLGRVDFGSSPGGDFCDRSADGAKLAFAHTQLTPSGLLTRMQLTWLDLRDMLTIHEVAPELTNIGMLGWSPRLDRLAVFACFGQDTGCGLYLFNPAVENAYQIVLEDVYTMWPALWNPDGTQIAFVNHTPANENALYVVDITTGQVVYQGTFDADRWQVPTNSPINAWGVTFPRGMTGSRCFDAQ
jgi:hypothetical protein